MTNALQTQATGPDAAAIEQVLIGGDLAPLTPAQRVSYYNAVCKSLDLNPLTRPFDYLRLNNKIVLYPKKDATDQLRMLRSVSITRIAPQYIDDLYVVTADARTPDGRTDSATGAVCITGLAGEAKANAIMKAETKAKRRVTLSICGLGMTDESEVGSIEDAEPVNVNVETGEIVGEAKPIQPPQRKSAAAEPPKPSVVDGPAFERPSKPDPLTVTKVEPRKFVKDGQDKLFYTVHFSDGRKGSTFSESVAKLAAELGNDSVPCECVIVPGKKEGTFNLQELARANGDGQ